MYQVLPAHLRGRQYDDLPTTRTAASSRHHSVGGGFPNPAYHSSWNVVGNLRRQASVEIASSEATPRQVRVGRGRGWAHFGLCVFAWLLCTDIRLPACSSACNVDAQLCGVRQQLAVCYVSPLRPQPGACLRFPSRAILHSSHACMLPPIPPPAVFCDQHPHTQPQAWGQPAAGVWWRRPPAPLPPRPQRQRSGSWGAAGQRAIQVCVPVSV